MAIEKDQFNIVILDAEKLIRKYDVVNTGDAWHIRYQVDYSLPWHRKWFTKTENLLNDNALFYQIRDICDLKLSDQKRLNRDLLKKTIVYIDFNGFFKRIDQNQEIINPYENSYSESNLSKTNDSSYDEIRIKEIIDQGVYIRFDEEEDFKKFVPMDKSNSMSKKSILSFIREDLKSKLDARLNLNIDFKRIEVQLSKYYAYRGLYLTDARRVCDKDVLLNCNSVIVLDDCYRKSLTNEIVFCNEEDGYKLKNGDPEVKIPVIFDGEGIISPFFSEKIADDLKLYIKNKDNKEKTFIQRATSFQVRLPFCKGMLHTVDFKGFVQKYGKVDGNEFVIEDVFGFNRNLLNAEIVLTKSMLKCTKWLKFAIEKLDTKEKEELHELEKEYKRINGGETKDTIDPMWFYFYQLEKCKHALYIVNTNLSYGNVSKIKLGYQFLNTLKLKMEDLDYYTEQTKKYVNAPFSYLKEFGDITDDEEDDSFYGGSNVDIWKKALFKNDNLMFESKIKRELRNIGYNIMQEFAYGRFLVDGEVRILSRDLLEFLIYLLRRQNRNNPNIPMLEQKRMYKDCFFMPFANVPVKPRKYYAVLRNPHLSRNEQCALTPYLGGDIYKEYFGNLRGVIMVAHNSLDPMALGGADFDGDIVKFIYDERINKAVLETNYDKKKTKKGELYKRKKAIIDIKGTKGKDEIVPEHIPYYLIRNTFDNKVGLISNRAIRIGKKQYFAEDHNKEYDGPKCEQCAILTGLEIDAAKSGEHPDLSILENVKDKENDKEIDYISDFKQRFEDNFVGENNSKISKTNVYLNNDIYQVVKYKSDKKEKNGDYVIEYPIGEEEYLLGQIPVRFFEMVIDFGKVESGKKSDFFFEFQKDPDWEESMVSSNPKYVEEQKKVAAVIYAYRKVKSINRSLNRWNKRRNNSKYFAGYTHNTLEWQYDMEIFWEKWDLVDKIMVSLDELFDNVGDVKKAIDVLKNKKWAFCLPEEKKQVLNEIFYPRSYPGELFDIVSNFRERGYKLLYYMLMDLRSMKEAEEQDTEYLDRIKENDEPNDKKDYDSDEYDMFYKKIYDSYYDMISNEERGTIKNLLNDTISRVKDILKERDTEYQLKLLYSLKGKADKDSEFFWAYFTSEMLDYVGGATSC